MEDKAKGEWEKYGIWIPPIPYGAGHYNTSFCVVRDSEADLFLLRVTRPDEPVRDNAILQMNGEGILDDIVRTLSLGITLRF